MASLPLVTAVRDAIKASDMWTVLHTPAVATQATKSKAAGAAGVQHVAKRLFVMFAVGATAQTAAVNVNLIDGATGGAAILWALVSALLPASSAGIWYADVDNLFAVGTAATAMTLEFSAAGAAGTAQSLTLQGFDIA